MTAPQGRVLYETPERVREGARGRESREGETVRIPLWRGKPQAARGSVKRVGGFT